MSLENLFKKLLTKSGRLTNRLQKHIDNKDEDILNDLKILKDLTNFYPNNLNINIHDKFQDIKVRLYIIENKLTVDDLKCKNPKCDGFVSHTRRKNLFLNNYCKSGCGTSDPKVKALYEKTNLKKYGEKHYMKTDKALSNINLLIQKKQQNITNKDKYNNKIYIEENFVISKKFLKQKFCNFFNVSSFAAYDKLHNMGIEFNKQTRSEAEHELEDFLREININNIILNEKEVIGKELDLYLPDHNLAIEFNGLFWHSYGLNYSTGTMKSYKNKHLIKTQLCEDKNIQLLHINENEWVVKKDIWKSMIKSKLICTKKIFARKCEIKEISFKESNKFILENHISGNRNANINIGLYYKNELVSIMTFGAPLIKTKNYQYELIRFCNKKNYTITGGASRLLSYFERNYNPLNIVSYANRRWSNGNLYDKLGFEFQNDSIPNFQIYNPNTYEVFNRIQMQKHKLEKIIPVIKSMSAKDNLLLNNFRFIWDSGNKVYLKVY